MFEMREGDGDEGRRRKKRLTRAVDHDGWVMLRTSLCNRLRGGLDVLCSIVGSGGTSTKNDMHVLVSTGLDDSGKTLFSDTHESMWVRRRAHSIDCYSDLYKPIPRHVSISIRSKND